ncbi:MAG: N-6 DNA methylase [Promethearchaeota archaeon]
MVFIKGDSQNSIKKAFFDDLMRYFQKCHDLIWEGGKRDPATAFDEFSKLLMAKIYDEKNTIEGEKYGFQVQLNDKPKHVAERIKDLYAQVRALNPTVFKVDITLPDEIILEIVSIIQNISLKDTDVDIKGRAFEQFLGKVLRDDYGQYFTPKTVVKCMIEILNPNENDIIIDPACGSGGFLLNSLIYVMDKLSSRHSENLDLLNEINGNFINKLITGIEINDRIARIALMDLIIHGGGLDNLECNNALLDYSKFNKNREIKPNKYSIVLTNPPFGAATRNKNLLEKYELAESRENQKTEILFIERCLDLLSPGGKLGIVLPDSVLTNTSLQYVRNFILERAKILAVISLPQHTFVPSGAGVKSSLVFLEKTNFMENKKLAQFLDDKYQKDKGESLIFMAVAKHVGYDSRGEKDSNDLLDVQEDWKNYITSANYEFKKSFLIKKNQIRNNFSADQFVFYSGYANWKLTSLSELCEAIFTGRTPARKLYTTKGYKILKVRDLTNKGIDWDNQERGFVSREFFLKHQNIQLRANDILFISAAHHPKYIGEKIDIIDTIPEEYMNGVVCSAELLVLRVNAEYIDPYYVFLFLKTQDGYNAIQACIRGQTAHVYPKDIKTIKIPIPPEKEFDKIKEDLGLLKQSLIMKSDANESYLVSLNRLKKFLEKAN